jgi:hypothetical protein
VTDRRYSYRYQAGKRYKHAGKFANFNQLYPATAPESSVRRLLYPNL